MSNYVKSTNFATKDSLASGNPAKLVKGTELNTEFDNIASAINSKADAANAALTVAAAPVVAAPESLAVAKPVVASREQRKDDAQQRKEANEKKRPLKKEQDGIEKNMASLEAEKQSLHNKLASPLAPADIAEAGKRLKVVEDELEELELRWLELTTQLETLA